MSAIARLGAVLLLALAGACTPAPTAGPPGPLAWGPCAGAGWAPGARCADLPVPLDHAHPEGPRITVRVSWTPAADPAHRRGVLIANPGGPGTPGLRDAALASSVADSCARHGGPVLAHMSTADVAADMESLRQALGVPTFSYYGSSYGTYLGVVYDTLYPGRTDRVVLDSLVDSEHGWFEQTRQVAATTETRVGDYAAWAAARSPGTTPADVHARTLALIAERERAPLTLPGVTLDGALLRRATYALVGRNRFDALAGLLRCAGAPPGDPCGAQAAAGLGALRGDDDAGDAAASAYLGVVCSDAPWPRDPAVYARAAAQDAARFPTTAGGFAQIGPCASWPVPARPAITAAARPGPATILMLNNTHDRISSLEGARSVRAALGERARFVTVEGWNHQVLSNHDPCADAAVADWLGAGRLPADEVRCG